MTDPCNKTTDEMEYQRGYRDGIEMAARAVERHPWPAKCAEAWWGMERSMVATTVRELLTNG